MTENRDTRGNVTKSVFSIKLKVWKENVFKCQGAGLHRFFFGVRLQFKCRWRSPSSPFLALFFLAQSLFHRVSLDPLEKEWLKSCAVGNVATQRRLLAQEPGLVLKKVRLRSSLCGALMQKVSFSD